MPAEALSYSAVIAFRGTTLLVVNFEVLKFLSLVLQVVSV